LHQDAPKHSNSTDTAHTHMRTKSGKTAMKNNTRHTHNHTHKELRNKIKIKLILKHKKKLSKLQFF